MADSSKAKDAKKKAKSDIKAPDFGPEGEDPIVVQLRFLAEMVRVLNGKPAPFSLEKMEAIKALYSLLSRVDEMEKMDFLKEGMQDLLEKCANKMPL